MKSKHLIAIFLFLLLASIGVVECKRHRHLFHSELVEFQGLVDCRKHTATLKDFGGIGDGKTSNTQVFKAAIANLSLLAADGGAQLVIPPGKWVTGPFSLISHFTLYIHKQAVILGSQDESEWLLSKKRFSSSLIFGSNLTDVVITGGNGKIDGQGEMWWDKFRNKNSSSSSRPPYNLIEMIHTNHLLISNLTFLNSPSLNLHPLYSSNVIIQSLTIIAPTDAPNTDGIQSDSCTDVLIQDNYIVSGGDCVSVKSGWLPSEHIIIRKLTCISPTSSVIGLGSEISGLVHDVRAEDIIAFDTKSAVRIQTGFGGYVKDIFVRRMSLHKTNYVFLMTGNSGFNNDPKPKKFPSIRGISFADVLADNVSMVADFHGLKGDTLSGICISDVNIVLANKYKKVQWNCSNVEGVTRNVNPKPCRPLASKGPIICPFPNEALSIEGVQLKMCSVKVKT
ncbi:probable polygalacturonase [Impatiens glandulifera]|uniref:probable polygalacturonase n=1 Tax=Impatiens glandulifera TaxID=253017 RepID=UPI001FB06FE1|nr:probable polygalacturonase [Impatiens glandulifera]